jgi:hypothetical protein
VNKKSMQKLKRKVLFPRGIDFIPTGKSGDIHSDDL